MRPIRPPTPALVYWTALALGLVYTVVTPPLTVPDEGQHFFRALAVAQGRIAPAPRPAPMHVEVDEGLRVLAWHAQIVPQRSAGFSWSDVEVAWHIGRQGWSGPLSVVPLYTPLPYLPSAAVAAASDLVRARPLVTFWGGRIVNLAVWLGVIALACRIAPQCAPLFAVVIFLPMSLFLFASWSADAAAIAMATLLTALLVRAVTAEGPVSPGETAILALAAFFLTLCKPVYGLMPALAVTIPRIRFSSVARKTISVATIAAGTLAGAALSTLYFRRAYFNMRPDLPVDPAAQLQCIAAHPGRFLHALFADLASNGRYYLGHMIGRFGHNEFSVPDAVIVTGWLVIVAVAASTWAGLPPAFRLAAAGVVAATVAGIVLSQYLIWSVACGETVEGMQGRYFLPILPLVGLAAGGWFRRPPPPIALAALAVIGNAVAIATLLVWYW